jgi:hypothetical protein
MFTGIVQGLAAVAHVSEADNFKSFKIQFPAGKTDGIQIGASVAINGTCLTVTAIERDVLSFDVMSETLRATSLGVLKVCGQWVLGAGCGQSRSWYESSCCHAGNSISKDDLEHVEEGPWEGREGGGRQQR